MQPVLSPRATRALRSPQIAALLALIALPLGVILGFSYAPTAIIPLEGGGADDDWPQKIFYLHVPIAFAAYFGFLCGAWNALLYLLKGEARYDVRSYVGIHVGIVFGCLVLATGSLWAKAAWGVWWQWGDRQLLVFLVLFLFYAGYFMVRFSIAPGEFRARASAAVALIGVGLVPVSFLAVRIAETVIHPTVLAREGGMTTEMAVAFGCCVTGFLALTFLMIQLEATAKLAALRQAPASGPAPAAAVTVEGAV